MSAVEVKRVVSVYSPTTDSRGTGYLLTPSLILTAAHCVGPISTVVSARRLHGEGAAMRLGEEKEFRVQVRGSWSPKAPYDDYAMLVADDTDPLGVAHDGLQVLRLGKILGTGVLPAEAVGFPAAQSEGSSINTEHARGTIAPLSGGRPSTGSASNEARLLNFQVESGSPLGRAGSDSLWSGASGSAVVAGGCLVGVLTEDRQLIGARLQAVRISHVLDETAAPNRAVDCLRQDVARHERPYVVLDMENVWAGSDVLEPAYSALPANWSVADLLLPRYDTVPFTGREEDVTRLRAWCSDEGSVALLMTGPAAVGKTRLARHLCRLLSQEKWVCGFVVPGATEFSALLDLDEHRLVVVDEADLRVGQLDALLQARRERRNGKLKVLIVARSDGPWWHSVRRRHDGAVSPSGVKLTPLASFGERLEVYNRAWQFFCEKYQPHGGRSEAADGEAQLTVALPAPGTPVPVHLLQAPLPRVSTPAVDKFVDAPRVALEEPDFANCIFILVQALADALNGLRRDNTPPDPREPLAPTESIGLVGGRAEALLDYVLELERMNWVNSAAAAGLPNDPVVLERVIAVASFGYAPDSPHGVGESEAAARLRLVPDLSDATEMSRRAYARWQHERYEGPGYLRALQPQRLAEHLAARLLRDFPELTSRLLAVDHPSPAVPAGPVDKARQAVKVLRLLGGPTLGGSVGTTAARLPGAGNESGTRPPHGTAPDESRSRESMSTPINVSFGNHLPALLELSMEMVVDVESDVVGKNLAAALEAAASRLAPDAHAAAAASKLEEDCPDTLLELAVAVTDRALEYYRTAARTTEHRAAQAEALKCKSRYLADLGKRGEAEAFAWDAVEQFRALVRVDGCDDHQLGLAHALTNLAVRLDDIGRVLESVDPAREAVRLYDEQLVKHQDRWHHVHLAFALCNLSRCAADAGRGREALQVSQEALELLGGDLPPERERDDPADELLAAEALANRTLSRQLGEENRGEEAVAVARRSAELYKRLSDAQPHKWARDYARVLNVLGRRYAELGKWDESIEHHKDALREYEKLEQQYREAVRPDHAEAVRDLAHSYLCRSGLNRWFIGHAPPPSRGGDSDTGAHLPLKMSDAQTKDVTQGRQRIAEALHLYAAMSRSDQWARRSSNGIALRIRAELALVVGNYGDAIRDCDLAIALHADAPDTSWQARREALRPEMVRADGFLRRDEPGDEKRAAKCYASIHAKLDRLDAEKPAQVRAELAFVEERLESLRRLLSA